MSQPENETQAPIARHGVLETHSIDAMLSVPRAAAMEG